MGIVYIGMIREKEGQREEEGREVFVLWPSTFLSFSLNFLACFIPFWNLRIKSNPIQSKAPYFNFNELAKCGNWGCDFGWEEKTLCLPLHPPLQVLFKAPSIWLVLRRSTCLKLSSCLNNVYI